MCIYDPGVLGRVHRLVREAEGGAIGLHDLSRLIAKDPDICWIVVRDAVSSLIACGGMEHRQDGLLVALTWTSEPENSISDQGEPEPVVETSYPQEAEVLAEQPSAQAA